MRLIDETGEKAAVWVAGQTVRSLPQMVTKRHPNTLFDLAKPAAL
jgi:hypothetical protein